MQEVFIRHLLIDIIEPLRNKLNDIKIINEDIIYTSFYHQSKDLIIYATNNVFKLITNILYKKIKNHRINSTRI
jgi:hypothetical protein